MSKTNLGNAWPLGSTITKRGVNFSVAAPDANHLELLLFANGDSVHPNEVIRLNNENKSGDYWHIEVEGLSIGCHYAYRVYKNKHLVDRNNKPKEILLDPCAREISGWELFNRNKRLYFFSWLTINKVNNGPALRGSRSWWNLVNF